MSQIQYVSVSDNICDFCHKSLSVTPVKIYPNRRIKCGRCSTSKDELDDDEKEEYEEDDDEVEDVCEEDVGKDVGVNSMYNRIARRIFFECINKFDGCTKLLQSSEVLEHEKLCLSKTWICPICLEEMFSFLIIRHFKLNHPESLLEKLHFQVTDLKNIEKTFLYQLESDLLFVNFRDISNSFADVKRFSLNVLLHLGRKDYIKNLKVDFFDKNIHILDKTINTNGSTSVTYNITLNITRESKLLVMLHLYSVESKSGVINSKTYICPICLEEKSTFLLITRHFKLNHPEFSLEDNNLKPVPQFNSDSKIFCKQLGEYLKILLFQKRDIFPNEKFKESVVDLFNPEKATLSYKKSGKKVTITFSCYNCSLMYPTVFAKNKELIYLIGKNCHYYNIICVGCYPLFDYINLVEKKDFTMDELKDIMFFCIWGCGTFCEYNKLYIHERNCLKQICQKCPIESCFYYLKLYEIENHVKKEHLLVISPSLNLYDPLVTVNLDTSKSTIERIMLVWCVCVLIKFKWEQPNWSISLTCEIPGTDIKARIFDKNKKLISTIFKRGSMPYYDEIKVQLRCLVTKKENER